MHSACIAIRAERFYWFCFEANALFRGKEDAKGIIRSHKCMLGDWLGCKFMIIAPTYLIPCLIGSNLRGLVHSTRINIKFFCTKRTTRNKVVKHL